jgi:hypothetical protein
MPRYTWNALELVAKLKPVSVTLPPSLGITALTTNDSALSLPALSVADTA